ncbi:TonB-dependent siderophore receptor [Steroidobacter sp.]|uniref:TonB-dependent siderophore receptor n=1 Tax=Steroidobacter sp. TaxID=1978227 RepID=UPI001A4F91E3|nr:TonB-dependent receptor [Steroidobacter sp.]MBL8267539.1 TonB-dependent receptor [Steroidobacter sp.]
MLLVTWLACSAAAAPSRLVFDVPEQPLGDALRMLARQSGYNVLFNAADLGTRLSPPISGEYTLTEALDLLLEDASLDARVSPDDLMVVVRQREQIGSIVVLGKQFHYAEIESANKMPLPARRTPQSVKVITQDMIEFASLNEFEDTYRIDASSHASHLNDGFARNYFRGFLADSTDAFKIDGMRAFGMIEFDIAPLERIEIVKGATSTMYGHASVGGTLNAVSKQPTPEFGGSVSLEAGGYDHYRAGLDLHGALTDDQRLSGRLVASYLDEQGPVDFSYRRVGVLAPSLQYQVSDATSLTLSTQYQQHDFMPLGNFGVQIAGDSTDPDSYLVPRVPRSRFVGQPDQFQSAELVYGRLLLDHSFVSGWRLRANAQMARVSNDGHQAQGITTHADGTTDVEIFGGTLTERVRSAEVHVFGTVDVGDREVTLFFGVDRYQAKNRQQSGLAFAPGSLTGFSVYQPDYSLLPRALRSPLDYTLSNPVLAPSINYAETSASDEKAIESGYTAQVFTNIAGPLSAMLGMRYSEYEHGSAAACCSLASVQEPLPAKTYYRNYATTYQAGLTYTLGADVTAYVSYGQSFTPRNEFTFDAANPTSRGRPVGPEDGETYEIGLKGELPGRAFSWSTALFEVARTNIAQANPDPALNERFVVMIGKQRARGLEFDAQGELAPGWSAYVSAAVLENEFVGEEFNGYPSYFAPRWGVSLFSSYQWQEGRARGFGIGGGVVYKKIVDARPFFGGAQGHALDLFDDVFEVDLRVFYESGPWHLSLAVTNALAERYYSPSYPSPYYAINVNPGRQLIGSLKYLF